MKEQEWKEMTRLKRREIANILAANIIDSLMGNRYKRIKEMDKGRRKERILRGKM